MNCEQCYEREKDDYRIVRSAVSILSVTCAADPEQIIDHLVGFLWDEGEAEKLKKTGVEHEIFIGDKINE